MSDIFLEPGFLAATFLNLETGQAVRVVSSEEAREIAAVYAPEIAEKYPQQQEAYTRMPDSVMFRVQQVDVNINDYDMPGPTRYKVACSRCGQVVRDRREVIKNSRPYCKPCANGAYFKNAKEISWPDMNWALDKHLTQKRSVRPPGPAGQTETPKSCKLNVPKYLI